MRIAVNTRLLIEGKLEGIGRFTYEMLKRLVLSHPEHEFIFIFDRKPSETFLFAPNVKAVVAHPQARHPILWYLFFEWGVRRVLKKYAPDVFLSPDGWLSLGTNVPSIAVIHDLNFESHPEFLPIHIRWYYRHFFPLFARKAERIATVSQYTADDLRKHYDVPTEKVDVVFNAADESFKPASETKKDRIRQKYSNGKTYFLFVGLIHPRKNLLNQLKGFEDFKSKTGCDYKFLVVGATHWKSNALNEFLQTSPAKEDIHFLGRKSFEELTELYAASFALSYVSYFEGFGIPIIEAMQSGVPVITSTTSSMPEIAGEAGITVDPDNVNGISEGMMHLFRDDNYRIGLINDGFKRAADFSWEKTANKIWNSIERIGDTEN